MSAAVPPPTVHAYRRAFRPAGKRMIGGVAQGLADHLGVPVIWVRVAFVIATWLNFAGIIAYAVFWRLLPIAEAAPTSPGLAAATRRGLRTSQQANGTAVLDGLQTAALLAFGGGVILLMNVLGWGLGGPLFVPILAAVAGIALIWRQADDARWSRWVVGTSGWEAITRLALGGLLLALALAYFVARSGGVAVAADVASAIAVAIVGLALLLGPWIYRLTSDLTAERRERIRSQERADVAAHLHDSVLQTLALLQKNAADPAAVATLARRQERELRDWLYGEAAPREDSLRGALSADALDIETMHQVAIEVVGVGDTAMDDDVRAMCLAAREAMANAAKHSGAGRVDVYTEVSATAAEVFVRDRGAGFDLSGVAADRMGVRGSIVDRMRRHGGTATVRSGPDEGTEVRLNLPLRSGGSAATTVTKKETP